jgi:hypothetical protein
MKRAGGLRLRPSFTFTEQSSSAVAPLLIGLVGLAARIAALFVLRLAALVALLMLLTRGLSLRVVLLLLRIPGLFVFTHGFLLGQRADRARRRKRLGIQPVPSAKLP